MNTRLFRSALLGLAVAVSAQSAGAGGLSVPEEERAARWRDVSTAVFGERPIAPTETLMKIEAPVRAMDAALVPITLTMPEKDRIKAVHLFIDDNPSPYAAHFTFGPAADPGELKLRVRINDYTYIHAIAETQDGALHEANQFVKASGGCSAPMSMSDEEAMKGMGSMKMKFAQGPKGAKSVEATLMVRHPSFSGMQMNQVTREYTPARYIDKIVVTTGDRNVFVMDGDISISANPVMNFAFLHQDGEAVKVVTTDNQGGSWEQIFPVPTPSN